ncbi:MAG: prolipoprotein diacylglyceryl transferase, partial [Clostridiaceae bacterium]|nr:prolipoprotein diacylglyceryl transferase [Clostridiaceae bacterium]
PLGQAIGRWGNFFNQEAFGTNTMLPWGMFSEGTYSYLSKLGVGYAPLTPVHPTFLYESIANFIIFFVLLKVRSKSKNTGKVVGLYFILYGIVRFFVEGIRTDPLYIGNTEIRVTQALSLVLVVLGIILIALAKKNTFSKNIPSIESEVDDAENSNQAMDDLSVESTDDSGENTTEEDTTEEDTAAEEMGDKSSQDIIKEPEENILGETENIEKNSESSESDTKIDE